MTVICKFEVVSITMCKSTRRVRDENGDWKKSGTPNTTHVGYVVEPCIGGEVKLSPVYANDDPRHENSQFWDASPSGEFKLQVNNLEALKRLEVGKQYYIRIDEAS